MFSCNDFSWLYYRFGISESEEELPMKVNLGELGAVEELRTMGTLEMGKHGKAARQQQLRYLEEFAQHLSQHIEFNVQAPEFFVKWLSHRLRCQSNVRCSYLEVGLIR